MSKNGRLAILLLLQALVMLHLCGCRGTKDTTHAGPHWGYSGHTGPAHWGDLSPDFILAKTGNRQSPIDIKDSKASQGKLDMRYGTTGLDLVNNGHAIQLNYREGSFLTMGRHTYELKQFHLHSPSEHTVDGKRYDMEMHLVHVSASGRIAVVGVLFQEGKENVFLKPFWNMFPGTPEERIQDKKLDLNVGDVLPRNRSYYAYDGSLTTPPCSEGVKWYVLSTPAEISPGQLAEFQTLYKGNFRPVQPLNGRTIHHCL